MAPSDGPQQAVPKQAMRRIVPAIPRQLTRPRKQVAKRVDDKPPPAKETVVPAASATEQQSSNANDAPEDLPSAHTPAMELKGEAEAANGHAAEEAAAKPSVDVAETVVPQETTTEQNDDQNKHTQASGAAKVSKDVPTQLPPLFYPSGMSHQSHPASSSPVTLPTSSFPHGPRHTAQPSIESVVFGGHRDTSTSPAPPLSQSSVRLPPQGPPLVNGAARPFSPAHTHHDMSAQQPSFVPYAAGLPQQAHGDWMVPNQHTSSHFPRPLHTNGVSHLSRTPSQASSAAFDVCASYNHHSRIATPDFINHIGRPPSYPQPAALPYGGAPSMQQSNTDLNNVQDLRQFLLARFGSYDFADYVLDLAADRSFPAHALLLARSPGMQGLMRSARREDGTYYWRINIPSHAYFKNPDAFIHALRYLYGGELLDVSHLLQHLPPPEATGRDAQQALFDRMAYLLSYVAAGLTLDMSDIHHHGVMITDRLLRWDTLGLVLEFSSKGHFVQTMAAQHLLHAAVNFMVLNFPFSFSLDTRVSEESQQRENEPSFPLEGRRHSHYRLKGIRFGDNPTSQETPSVSSVLSDILLTLPHEVLRDVLKSHILLDRLGSMAVIQIMHAVITERERRRANALATYSEHDKYQDAQFPSTHDLGWEEAIEPTNEEVLGCRIIIRRAK